MRVSKILLFVLVTSPAFGAPRDDGQHQHPAGNVETLGKVHFPVSCNAAAQKQFERAAAMLYSFWYEEAAKAFSAVTEADSGCAMGYWGIAMSYWHPLWYPPDSADLRAGRAAVQKAKAMGAEDGQRTTERERGYIAAIETFNRGLGQA